MSNHFALQYFDYQFILLSHPAKISSLNIVIQLNIYTPYDANQLVLPAHVY